MDGKFKQNLIEKFDEKALDAFVNDMNQYDKDHSNGAWLGRGLASIFMRDINEKTEGTEDQINVDEGLEKLHKSIQKNITINDLESRHNQTLNKLGLNLESPNKDGDIDENETYAIGSIQMNLEDKVKYLSFLKSLTKEKITDTQKKILEMTVEKIIFQVQHEYKLKEADERLLELFSGMRDIVSEYERLGMGENVVGFKDYLEYANSGYLREYIYAKNNGMFKPIGEGFALSTYQRDATYTHYLKYWSSFFETITEVGKNPDAKEFYNQILKYGKDCITFAENDPKLAEYEARGNNPDHFIGLRKAINEVKEKVFKITEL